MQLFLRTDENNKQFLCGGKSGKDIASKMGISSYLFKKAGWEKIVGEDRKFYMVFIVVSRGTAVGEQSVIAGPFTPEELEIRRRSEAREMRKVYDTTTAVVEEVPSERPKRRKRRVSRGRV